MRNVALISSIEGGMSWGSMSIMMAIEVNHRVSILGSEVMADVLRSLRDETNMRGRNW